MFYISLPYFYENYKFNNFFKDYIHKQNTSKNSTLITKFNIEYVYGSFPWSYWNGGINNHQGTAALAFNMQQIIYQSFIPIRLDISNTYLNNLNYFDTHENSILRIANGTNTFYEISDLNLMSYIKNYNLNNKFIISNNAQLIHEFNTDILNVFQEQPEIDLINIGYNPFDHLKDNIDFSQIKDKNKLEISIGYCQDCSFQRCMRCSSEEQKNIYNFSKQSFFINCPNEYKINNYYNEIEPYLKQGIKHFKIITTPKDLNNFNIKIIKSFVKPEHQGECINEYYQRISK